MKSGVIVSVILAFALGKGVMSASETNSTQLATLGGGCFWCLEALYETFDGVKAVTSGYSGGAKENPTYKQVCSDGTGHAVGHSRRLRAGTVGIRKHVQMRDG